jgi:hypothetical protein
VQLSCGRLTALPNNLQPATKAPRNSRPSQQACLTWHSGQADSPWQSWKQSEEEQQQQAPADSGCYMKKTSNFFNDLFASTGVCDGSFGNVSLYCFPILLIPDCLYEHYTHSC